MIYLTGCIPKNNQMRDLLLAEGFGIMTTPFSIRTRPSLDWQWALDNGCFSNRWEEALWLRWLDKHTDRASALFATVPDVVSDHSATLERWEKYSEQVKGLGYRTAFVLQDGATIETIPMKQMDALFIGGSTKYKLSDEARLIVEQCKKEGKWIHMGRVNSRRRMQIAFDWGCDSVDGTFLAFAPNANTPRLVRHMQGSKQLNLFTNNGGKQ